MSGNSAMNKQTFEDIDFILDAVIVACYDDELSLLRLTLRRYQEGMTAQEALAWAAGKLSDTITFYGKTDNGRPHKKP